MPNGENGAFGAFAEQEPASVLQIAFPGADNQIQTAVMAGVAIADLFNDC